MPEIDLRDLPVADAYAFLMGAVVPRPIAFVTTLGATGVVNAAPFSSFVALSPHPPLVGFVVGGWEGRRKDTLANIARSGEFVINTVTEGLAQAVQRSAAPLPPEQGEVDAIGLATQPSVKVAPPRIASAPIALECVLDRIVPFGAAPDRLIAGCIVRAFLAEGLWRGGRIERSAWQPLGRLGGGAFCRLGEVIEAA
jgi:flavin reductase (DIM6/NTAB) family NADH-FMN oxidoreductase RutF